MDNRTVDIVSEGKKALQHAIGIIWSNAPGGKATHYKIAKYEEKVDYYGTPTSRHIVSTKESIDGVLTLILFWHAEKDAIALPYPLTEDEAVNFIDGWLTKVEYEGQPDHDGDNGKGWRVFTEQWGHVAGNHYAIVGVQPVWAMYGK
jgi:hypothetical protein